MAAAPGGGGKTLGPGGGRVVADVAQLVERVLGKDEVTSSILVIGSSFEVVEGWEMRE